MDQLELVRAGPAAPGEANSAAEREKTEAFHLKKMADYKSLSKSLMDVALLTANADQLRFTLAKVKIAINKYRSVQELRSSSEIFRYLRFNFI